MGILGKARIVKDPEELTHITILTSAEVASALTRQVLIKVKILKVDFFENRLATKNYIMKKTQALFYGLFDLGALGARSYNFSTNSVLQQFGF